MCKRKVERGKWKEITSFTTLFPPHVKRGFNSRGSYEDSTAFNRIVKEMEDEFEPVADLLK